MKRAVAVVVLVIAGAGVAALAQDFLGGRRAPAEIMPNVPYDGRITFVRLR
jgi:hypothetical protein